MNQNQQWFLRSYPTTLRLAVALAVSLATGCFGVYASKPRTPQSQAKLVLDSESMGKLDAQLSTDSPKPLASATDKIDTFGDRPLMFTGLTDGKICFMTLSKQNSAFSTADITAMWSKRRHLVAAHETAAAIAAMSQWPQDGTALEEIEVVDEKVQRGERKVTIKLCGPAPTTEHAKYLSVATLPDDAHDGLLYLWSIGP
jgi:hypothetical protein